MTPRISGADVAAMNSLIVALLVTCLAAVPAAGEEIVEVGELPQLSTAALLPAVASSRPLRLRYRWRGGEWEAKRLKRTPISTA